MAVLAWLVLPSPAEANPGQWRHEWPKRTSTSMRCRLNKSCRAGLGKDRIPSIDQSRFVVVAQADGLAATEPVVGLTSRAIPYRS
jgi:hypothetical protein